MVFILSIIVGFIFSILTEGVIQRVTSPEFFTERTIKLHEYKEMEDAIQEARKKIRGKLLCEECGKNALRF